MAAALGAAAAARFGAGFELPPPVVRFTLKPIGTDRFGAAEVPPRLACAAPADFLLSLALLSLALLSLVAAVAEGPRLAAALAVALGAGRRLALGVGALRLPGGRDVPEVAAPPDRDEVALVAGLAGAFAGALAAGFARPGGALGAPPFGAVLPVVTAFDLGVGLDRLALPGPEDADLAAAEDFWSVRRGIVLA